VITLYLLTPRQDADLVAPPARVEPAPGLQAHPSGLVRALDHGPLVTWALGLLGVWWSVRYLRAHGLQALDPNAMNFMLLTVGLLLSGSPRALMDTATEAARACAGIIVQFPFYGGILGILVASGLAVKLGGLLPAGPSALPLSTFLSAGLVNLFVPSGGGQWAVQGPVVMQAAVQTGVEPGRVVLALAWGDQWTNLLQPFWALPLLGITGLRAGDILGYTVTLAFVLGLVFGLGTLF